jgi:hypothetical protein
MVPGVGGRCSEKACPLPAMDGGLCRHHLLMLHEARMFQQSGDRPDPTLYADRRIQRKGRFIVE